MDLVIILGVSITLLMAAYVSIEKGRPYWWVREVKRRNGDTTYQLWNRRGVLIWKHDESDSREAMQWLANELNDEGV